MADLIPVPIAEIDDDVARGERAVRRRRLLAGLGSATAVVLIAGGVALAGGTHSPKAQDTPYAGTSPLRHHWTWERNPNTRVSHRHLPGPFALHRQQVMASKAKVGRWRDVLNEHLSAYGTLQEYDGVGFSGSSTDYGTKLDWNGGGLLQFMIGPHWNAIQGVPGAPIPPMTSHTYQGIQARVGEANGVIVVSVPHQDGTIVTLLAATSFGNNGSTTDALGLTADNLIEAAADPRLSNPPER